MYVLWGQCAYKTRATKQQHKRTWTWSDEGGKPHHRFPPPPPPPSHFRPTPTPPPAPRTRRRHRDLFIPFPACVCGGHGSRNTLPSTRYSTPASVVLRWDSLVAPLAALHPQCQTHSTITYTHIHREWQCSCARAWACPATHQKARSNGHQRCPPARPPPASPPHFFFDESITVMYPSLTLPSLPLPPFLPWQYIEK